MDYKEKYEQALERAKGLYSQHNVEWRDEDIEYIFPELKESEDERIRKGLIEACKQSLIVGGFHKDKVISWLEKQGEQKPTKEKLQALPDGKQHLGWLEDADNVIKEEQKPAGKVEPKFHEGDWVVTSYGKVNQVVSVDKDGDGYTLDDGVYFSGSWCDMYHLWTIQDAKDGDVLCTYECDEPKIVFILKGTPKRHYAFSYHCYYNIMYPHFTSDSEKGCLAPNDEDVKPATKEQRDLLFQKMKEAGYEWDVEKKELKKIEKKPQRMISAEAKEALYDKPAWSEEDEPQRITSVT